MRNSERLPCETEPRRPYNAVGIRESLFLIDQDRLIVRLIRVMADGIKWPGRPGEATRFTNRIGLVIGAQGERKRQVRASVPLLLAIEAKTVEIETVPRYRRVGLPKGCVICFRIGWVHAAVEKGADCLGKQLSRAVVIVTVPFKVGPQEVHAKPKLMLAPCFHQVVGNLVRRCFCTTGERKVVILSSQDREGVAGRESIPAWRELL